MDILILFKALILGIIEGLTEFLPISSTGHLIVFGDLMNFQSNGKVFEIAIQLGAVLAVVFEVSPTIYPYHKRTRQRANSQSLCAEFIYRIHPRCDCWPLIQ